MYNLLIADDEEKIIWLIHKLIAWDELGLHLAATASDGQEAYEAALRNEVDIVITDIKMPRMDGLKMIEEVLKVKPHINFIVVSGYNQFEYAQKALRYGVKDFILKPIKKAELNNTLQKICQSRQRSLDVEESRNESGGSGAAGGYRKEFLKNLLNKTYKIPELGQLNKKYSFGFQGKQFQCLSVRINLRMEYLDDSVEREFILNKIQTMVREAADLTSVDYETLIWEDTVLALMNLEAEKTFDEYHGENLLKKIRVYLDAFECFTASMYLGGPVQFSQCGAAFRESFLGVKEQLALGNEKLITRMRIETLSAGENKVPLFNHLDRQNFRRAAEQCNAADMRMYLEKVFQKLEGLGPAPYREIYAQLGIVCNDVYDLIYDEIGKQPGILEEYRRIKMCVENAVGKEDLFQMVFHILMKMFEQYVEVKSKIRSKPVNRAREYIDEHIEESITLSEVAEHIHISANYLSQIFKQAANENFVDYVIRRKMERAKEYLKNTDETIAVIAEQVGYKDRKYFGKQFEKVVGLKPSKYRRLYR